VRFIDAFVAQLILRGVVVDALDGETITVKVDNRLLAVRLCAISAPKRGQAFAKVAHSHLLTFSERKRWGGTLQQNE
jgi:endonuclease YncB( thermonuclease family)